MRERYLRRKTESNRKVACPLFPHTHTKGIFNPDENEDWSEDDREAVRKTSKDSYMITPSGRIKVLRGDGKSEGEIPIVKLRKPGPLGGRKDGLDE